MELNKKCLLIISIIIPIIIFSAIYIPFYSSGDIFVIGSPLIVDILALFAGFFLVYDSFMDLKLRKIWSSAVIKTLIGTSIFFIHTLGIYFGYVRN
jgi:hypothetical protein